MAWLVGLLLVQDAMAATTFATDDVAVTAKEPDAAEALVAHARMEQAFEAQDIDEVADLFAEDLVVNTPANQIARREQVLGFFKSGRMNYEAADTSIETIDTRTNQVVIMGEQVIKPRATAANAGKTVRRRFTDVWRKEPDGRWRLTVRQATITSVQ